MTNKHEYYAIHSNNLLPPLGMLSIRTTSPNIEQKRIHRNYHIIYILNGNIKLSFKDSSIALSKGQAFIVPPNFEYILTTETEYSYFDIILSVWKNRAEKIWQHFVNLTKKGIITTHHFYFEFSFEDLKALFLLPTDINCYSLNVKAENILLNILEQKYPIEESTFKRKIAEITALNKNIVTLKELCELSGYSQTHFERLMLQNFGCSGVEYFNNIKLERICNLLKTTNLNLSEIAEKFDFYDTSHLNVFFKKRTGMTPGKYRKEN